ncbi:MAG TPA: hypothetical protein VFZ38_06245 [Vicinamibacterales bacterium]
MVTRLFITVGFVLVAAGLNASITSAREQAGFPSAADIDRFRNSVERVFMTDRGGTTPGVAACVMCHTW